MRKIDKDIYIVRHCEATGQHPSAPLTSLGKKQATQLASFFTKKQIDQIISSPFLRAQQSIQPLAAKLALHIDIDDRLGERVLSSENLPDWQEKLHATFLDPHLSFSGGESSYEAAQRIKQVVDNLETNTHTILVTHGNIMALLLRTFDDTFGFGEWKKLTNPDVYHLQIREDQTIVKRIWHENLEEM